MLSEEVKKQVQDPGLGAKYFKKTKRIINSDGSFNVKVSSRAFSSRNIYHYLINSKWPYFLLWVLAVYIFINSFFALIYVSIDIKLNDVAQHSFGEQFLKSFFFSVQTFTTVGYGVLAPKGIAANIIASLEALVGLMGFALATGLLYGRFSKPSAKIKFSKKAIVAPYKENGKALMFRVVNTRKSQLMEMEATVLLTLIEKNNTQEFSRKYYQLDLEVSKIVFFPLSWTIVHPIAEGSPLNNISYKELENKNAEILVMLKGFDETFSQVVYSRNSYLYNDIEWGAKFERPFSTNEEGDIVLNISDLDKMEKVNGI